MTGSHPDRELLDLALGRLEPGRREALGRALAADPERRARAEAVLRHLARYEALRAPPPPPFARLAPRLPRERARPERLPQAVVWAGAGLAAAALVVAIVLGGNAGRTPSARAGRGLVVSGAAHSGDRIEAGARVRATRPAEMWVGERVHLVLDGATALRYLDPHGVALEAGRLYVEVEGPYAFHVATPRGDVRVAGTIFEVDLTEGDLRVRVARGAVQVGTRRLAAGTRLAHGRIQAWPGHAGLWFDAPRLSLEAPPRVRRGEPLRLRLRLGTPGELPVPVAGPSASRRALWIEVQEPGGAVHEVVPSFDGRPFGLEPGARVTLRPDEPLPQEVRIVLPPGPGGTYRCRAMYRPEHEAPVISSGVGVEVVE